MQDKYYQLTLNDVYKRLNTSARGLALPEVQARLQRYGANVLPKAVHISMLRLFFKQFLNPLIYVLLFAAAMSLVIGEYTDAVFIFVVLLANAIIGLVQEFSAQRSAASLDMLVTHLAHVIREGETYEINAEQLVPGDIVLLESGDMVPADCRLINQQELRVDESLLSGESLPVKKNPDSQLEAELLIQEQDNMVFSGTLVVNGRATAVVTATAIDTELGEIAQQVLQREKVTPPLLIRMERFTWRLTWVMGVMTVIIAAVVLYQGMPWLDVLLLSAALAVAAIPEGLPVAITIALAVSIRRMAKRRVIARNLVAVEALGSCTYIATDKTGTLTRNEISVEYVALPAQANIKLPSVGLIDNTQRVNFRQQIPAEQAALIDQLSVATALANEAFVGHRDGSWTHHGDSMDVALLVMALNLGFNRSDLLQQWQPVSLIPFESARRYSASLHRKDQHYHVFTKGAVESIIDMCSTMATGQGIKPVDKTEILHQAQQLAEQGYRVLAVASAEIEPIYKDQLHENDCQQLCFLGLTGMIDPLRSESKAAVEDCHRAGIEVAMLTGDHPSTAFAIAKQLGLAQTEDEIISSHELRKAAQQHHKLEHKHVYARLEPTQKLDIVSALQNSGHFVAMTGDGANDAPALRAAHVGIAMGKSGTAVARETADIIIADDNFSSIVAGIEEGRIAYSNVRKVVHLLVSTGAGEIVLFFLSVLFAMPIPITAVQLLWLNLVTNGLQHIALAFEPGEGNELNKPPRNPDEAILNRTMIERILLAAVVMGTVAFATFYYLLSTGYSLDAARNGTLLLMVLFENTHVFNSRSETRSVFTQSLLKNKFILFSVIGAHILHIAAMYMPGLNSVLKISPISLQQWFAYLLTALSLLLASEIYKWLRR